MQPDRKNVAPTAQTNDASTSGKDGDWLKKARAAYLESTNYLDSNMRKTFDDAIKSFNSQHATDSKYNSPSYDKRSKLYRPKTRSVIRKNEAAGAAAFFSNLDVVDIQAQDPDDRQKVAGAAVMKAVLQYRLTKSVPWYQIVLGGLQDAQTVGVVCAHAFWDYKAAPQVEEAEEPKGMSEAATDEYPEQKDLPANSFAVQNPGTAPAVQQPTPPPTAQAPTPQQAQPGQPAPTPVPQAVKNPPLRDKPKVDLIPVENIRISPSADWMDPINSSPYLIHMIPMYVMDVLEKMESGEWRSYGVGEIRAAADTKPDSTRAARQKDRGDRYDASAQDVDAYTTVWIQRHIHRKEDQDWEFYTLGDQQILTTPVLLKNVVFHGLRPFVMGCCIIETHKIFPNGVSALGKNLQEEANEVANQRIDNVKFVLNKKWFVKRGKDVDVAGLVRNVPGGVVSFDDPVNDVREISWPDVTQSAYEEQSRIDNDMGELLGNFSPAQVMADHGINGPARNMQLLNQSSGTLVEYLLMTYVKTFVEPLLYQIMRLEQEYETDQVILAVAAKKAQAFQKYGVSEVTDQLLNQDLSLVVNVGMGATDPQMKLQRLTGAINTYVGVAKEAMQVPGINVTEVGKEIFGCVGYADGTRFFTSDNPQVDMLTKQLEEAKKMIEQMNGKLQEKAMGHQVKAEIAKATLETKKETVQIHEQNENLRNAVTHQRALIETDKIHRHEAMMASIQHKMNLGVEDRKNKTDGFKVIKKVNKNGNAPSSGS